MLIAFCCVHGCVLMVVCMLFADGAGVVHCGVIRYIHAIHHNTPLYVHSIKYPISLQLPLEFFGLLQIRLLLLHLTLFGVLLRFFLRQSSKLFTVFHINLKPHNNNKSQMNNKENSTHLLLSRVCLAARPTNLLTALKVVVIDWSF